MTKTKGPMTVKDLKEILERWHDDTPVHIGYTYGDYLRTKVAPEITGVAEESVRFSSRFGMHIVVTDPDDYPDGDIKQALILK